jgi:hypothetical protein
MYQNPATQLQLGRELDRERATLWLDRPVLPPTESVLDAVVRRLKQLIGTRPLQPLARGAA